MTSESVGSTNDSATSPADYDKEDFMSTLNAVDKSDPYVKRCYHVSEWMFAYLDHIQPKEGTEGKKNASHGKKRNAPPPLPSSNMVITSRLMNGIIDVDISRVSLDLTKEEGEARNVEVAKVKLVLLEMKKIITGLNWMSFLSVNNGEPFDTLDVYARFVSLATLAGRLFLPRQNLVHSLAAIIELQLKVIAVKNIATVAEVASPGAGGASNGHDSTGTDPLSDIN